MKINLILGLSVIFITTSCSNQKQSITEEYSNIKILEQGQSLDDDEVITSACKEFTMSKDSVSKFFSQSKTISQIELHNQYDILPCYSTGTLNFNSKLYNWRIRVGGTGVLSTDKETINKACSKVACSNIPNLH
ncbi:hypothetical protein [Kangiella spongicola]|uniref:Lipoprotein n=1 Tax=Kangiella spongicola TaxID=796379 RepID=A0A318D8B8_9GAMM|nr:hypothetical protein [Kangiella spongicola]PXF64155.1 hypothetical protein DL796_03175 [Kangiella spongicola]